MVRTLLRFLNREVSGLHEAAYLLGIFAFLSQVLALIRDRLLAHTFGASNTLDLYYTSFRIPDFIFVSVASLVSLTVLIPFLIERLDRSEREAKELINGVFSLFFLLIAVISVIAYVATPYLLHAFFPTFSAHAETLVSMTRIMLLSPIFLGFSNFLASITQIYKRFFIYAMSPIVYNVGIILGIVVLYPMMGMAGLAWGVAIGAFLHCFIQIPFVVGKSLFPRFSLLGKWSDVFKVLAISLPRTLTLSINELARFFLIVLAGGIAGGAISVFSFSWNLQSVPLTIIGVSYSVAAFPTLARLFSGGQKESFFEQMVVSSKHILFWTIPLTALFVVFRAHIVRIVLGSGQFNWSDTRLTAAALALFVMSLVPQSLMLLFVRSYYARGNTRKPLVLSLISAMLIVISTLASMRIFGSNANLKEIIEILLRVKDVPGTAVLVLPLGFSIGTILSLALHWIAFEWDFGGYTKRLVRSITDTVIASGIMAGCGYVWLGALAGLLPRTTFAGIFFQTLLAGAISAAVGAGVLLVLGNREFADIMATLHRKVWKAKAIPPDVTPS